MKLSDLRKDRKNANKGTARVLKMLANSFKNYGAERSILIDQHGRVIAGSVRDSYRGR